MLIFQREAIGLLPVTRAARNERRPGANVVIKRRRPSIQIYIFTIGR